MKSPDIGMALCPGACYPVAPFHPPNCTQSLKVRGLALVPSTPRTLSILWSARHYSGIWEGITLPDKPGRPLGIASVWRSQEDRRQAQLGISSKQSSGIASPPWLSATAALRLSPAGIRSYTADHCGRYPAPVFKYRTNMGGDRSGQLCAITIKQGLTVDFMDLRREKT